MSSQPGQKYDIAIAHKALLLSKGLSAADKEVAAAILDHFNKKTGQCDPSIARLAKLLGIGEKTVRRATVEVCQRGLFDKSSHGGKSYRASYRPKWSVFRSIVAEWDHRMRCIDELENDDETRSEVTANPGRKRPLTPGENDRQTHISNPSKKPISLSEPSEHRSFEPKLPSLEDRSDGLLKRESAGAAVPHYQVRERTATTGSTKAEAAWASAERRVEEAMAAQPMTIRQAYWTWCDEEVRNAAIRQDLKCKGSGIEVIKTEIGRRRLAQHAEAANALH